MAKQISNQIKRYLIFLPIFILLFASSYDIKISALGAAKNLLVAVEDSGLLNTSQGQKITQNAIVITRGGKDIIITTENLKEFYRVNYLLNPNITWAEVLSQAGEAIKSKSESLEGFRIIIVYDPVADKFIDLLIANSQLADMFISDQPEPAKQESSGSGSSGPDASDSAPEEPGEQTDDESPAGQTDDGEDQGETGEETPSDDSKEKDDSTAETSADENSGETPEGEETDDESPAGQTNNGENQEEGDGTENTAEDASSEESAEESSEEQESNDGNVSNEESSEENSENPSAETGQQNNDSSENTGAESGESGDSNDSPPPPAESPPPAPET